MQRRLIMIYFDYHIRRFSICKEVIMSEKRKDKKGRVLKSGESQRANGGYQYRYTDIKGKMCRMFFRTGRSKKRKRSWASVTRTQIWNDAGSSPKQNSNPTSARQENAHCIQHSPEFASV